MSTHIGAEPGQIAKTVLFPGDPLRAKFIAENFLDDVVQYNTVRNMFGYTGKYKGHPISVQGSGMGIPSLSIYATELIKFYGVQTIIRVGTAGGMREDVKIGDVILGQGSTTDSAVTANTFGAGIYYAPLSNFELLDSAYHVAQEMNVPVRVGNIFAADRFYNDEIDMKKLADYGCVATEMESAGLFLIGAKYNIKTLSILTCSDNLVTGEAASAKEREQSFTDMMKVSLETGIRA